MKNIGVLSDTHGFVNPQLYDFFAPVDEIWHAGDFGNIAVADELKKIKPLKGVYGNCDDQIVRTEFPEYLFFMCEEVKVGLIHIGGYPNHYSLKAKALIERYQPQLFIAGHSHILKVMFDKNLDLLHINPGAAGNFGIHRVITAVRFKIEGNSIKELEIMEVKRNEKIW